MTTNNPQRPGADDERLATLRSGSYANYPYNREEDRIFLLRLLDEARAERDQQTTLADQCQTTIAELHAPYWPMSITEKLAELEAELSRLRSPSSLDMVERARTLATSALANLWLILPDAEFSKAVVQVAATIEFVEREAREAAIEECAKYHDAAAAHYTEYGKRYSDLDGDRALATAAVHTKSAKGLRALSGAAPQAGWRPIDTAPKDGTFVWIWAAPREGLPGFIEYARYHEDAGWCVDELREATLWQPAPLPSPPTEDTKP